MGGSDPNVLAREILDACPDMCYVVDEEGDLLWWNDTLRETVGYDDETLDGMNVFQLVPADQREDAMRALGDAWQMPSNLSLTFEVSTGDGDHVPHQFTGAPLEVDGTTVFAGIGRDVSERHERERELRQQRDELERLNRISETVYEVIQAVTHAATREGIEEVTCERLAECELYQSVWMGRNEFGDEIEPTAGIGTSEDFLEVVADLNDLEWRRPAHVALETGEVQVFQHVSQADVPEAAKEAADRFDIRSGIAVPLVHRERVEGVLGIYSTRPEAFNDREREALRRLGYAVAFAIDAIQTERLVHADTATELQFRTTAPEGLLAALSERADGACYREWSTRTESGNYRHYVTAEGLDPEDALTFLADRNTVESADHVGTVDDRDVFELVTTDSLARRLLKVGATTTDVVAEDGEATVVTEIPGDVDTRPIVEAAEEMYDTELVSKRTVDRPVRTADEFHDPVVASLTDRQEAALRHAYLRGYFSWPRDATAEEIADTMDVSSPTLHYHLRQAEQALVESYLEYMD